MLYRSDKWALRKARLARNKGDDNVEMYDDEKYARKWAYVTMKCLTMLCIGAR